MSSAAGGGHLWKSHVSCLQQPADSSEYVYRLDECDVFIVNGWSTMDPLLEIKSKKKGIMNSRSTKTLVNSLTFTYPIVTINQMG